MSFGDRINTLMLLVTVAGFAVSLAEAIDPTILPRLASVLGVPVPFPSPTTRPAHFQKTPPASPGSVGTRNKKKTRPKRTKTSRNSVNRLEMVTHSERAPSSPLLPDQRRDCNQVTNTPPSKGPLKTPSGTFPDPSALVPLFSAAPIYPALARSHRISGTVTLLAGIAQDGSVRELKDVKGNPILAQAAKDAIIRWRYQPYESAVPQLLTWKPILVNFDPTPNSQ